MRVSLKELSPMFFNLLKQIHKIFFYELGGNFIDKDVRQVLKSVRKEVLKGCKVVFSRIVPSKVQADSHHLWKMAEQLGAICLTEVDSLVTHVIALDAGTEKSRWIYLVLNAQYESMDLVEVLSNLHALRQLYELLQNIEDDLQHINSKNVHQTSDPRARKLFKHILDDATIDVPYSFKEAQSVVHKTPCSSQLEQPKAMPKLQSPLSLDTVNASLNVVLNNEKDSKSSMVTSEKDEQYPVKSQSTILGSKVTTSSDVPLYKKKKCRACIAKEMKRQYSTKGATMSNERVEVPGKNSGDPDQQRDWGSGSVSFIDEQAKILPESNSKTIERYTH
ncbi:hypothetical protein ACLB2K_046816 [Fragaria x ananassa]